MKVWLLFAASTLSRLLGGLLVIKIIAVYIGATGLGQVGQFMSLMAIITTLAGGGIATGIVKYVAEFQFDKDELTAYLGAASAITLVASALTGIGLLLYATPIAELFLKDPKHVDVIRVLAGGQFLVALSNFMIGIVNGHKRVKAFAVISVLSVAVGAVGMGFAVASFGIEGAMYGLIWLPACTAFFVVPWYRLGLRFEWERIRPRLDGEKIKKLLGFSVMLLVTIMTLHMSQIAVRQMIETREGWAGVGYWQAAVKVSDAYLQFVTVILANYYLPKLAAHRSVASIRTEVAVAYKFAIPSLLVLIAGVFIFRDYVIRLIFSPEFSPVRDYFAGQLVGDFFKVCAYILGYIAVAKANVRFYVGGEFLQAALLLGLSYFSIQTYGAVGATYAYALTYMIYSTIAFIVYRVYLARSASAVVHPVVCQ